MASTDATDAQPATFNDTMQFNSLACIAGAGRIEPAAWTQNGGNGPLIDLDDQDKELFHRFDTFLNNPLNKVSTDTRRFLSSRIGLRVTATISRPASVWYRKTSLTCLFRLFRSTARGRFFLLTTRPSRLNPSSFLKARNKSDELLTEKSRFWNTASNSSDFRRRWLEGKEWSHMWYQPTFSRFQSQAESTFRPFARRRLITSRPPLVAILARKPWVLLRLITLGWNVLFIVLSQVRESKRSAILMKMALTVNLYLSNAFQSLEVVLNNI